MELHQLKKGKILIIGDIILDEYLKGTVSRVSPEAPVPVLRPEERELRLGGAANVAANEHIGSASPRLPTAISRTRIVRKWMVSPYYR